LQLSRQALSWTLSRRCLARRAERLACSASDVLVLFKQLVHFWGDSARQETQAMEVGQGLELHLGQSIRGAFGSRVTGMDWRELPGWLVSLLAQPWQRNNWRITWQGEMLGQSYQG
jgi:hypothetical protein